MNADQPQCYSKYFDQLNERRLALIAKKYDGGLDAREEKIFAWLQDHLSSFEPEFPWRNLLVMVYEAKQLRRALYPKGDRYDRPTATTHLVP